MNIEKIKEHYDHAREKHPYFCDRLLPTEANSLKDLQDSLSWLREEIHKSAEQGESAAFTVAGCEPAEFAEAVMLGDTPHAIEECYDTIAVLLRVIDVPEGRQPLGNPERGDLCHEN